MTDFRKEIIKMIRNSSRMMRRLKTLTSKEKIESRMSLTMTRAKTLAKRITIRTISGKENAITMSKSKPNSKISNRIKTKNSKLSLTPMVTTFFIN